MDIESPLIARLERHLDAIAQHNDTLHAMITVLGPEARAEAVSQTERHRPGGALSGRIISVKDNIDTAGIRTTRGSNWFTDRMPNHDATVVERIRRAGAIIIGKDNLHEFAFGATSQNPHHGACRNPWNPAAIPGGSSGGAGVSVAAGFSEIALGTDTGGSVRIPAALNGVSGLRPTVGRISNHGVMPVSASFDTVGPLARHARHVAAVYEVLAGFDPRDPVSVNHPVESWAGLHAGGFEGLKIGVPWSMVEVESTPTVAKLIRDATAVLAGLGMTIVSLGLAEIGDLNLALQTMAQADAAAVHRERFASNPTRFGGDLLPRLALGNAITGPAYADARMRQLAWKQEVAEIFAAVDVIALPTVGFPAPLAAASPDMIAATHRLTRLCSPWALAEVPAISIPCGFQNGMPIGLQLVGPQWAEARLLAVSVGFQDVTDHHLQIPPLVAKGQIS
ncbi:amidase [Acidisoma cellulosilytica]|uniref:Amidase n=1 Tax=Acidisoma cellulosilyticum TaxID=2802395 RepID=A0A964E631_9PROT|nr:amidase [Acidisoma cellulosilyticum]MCB8882588.1 amidase [Acidisoma cellulosilyticum]